MEYSEIFKNIKSNQYKDNQVKFKEDIISMLKNFGLNDKQSEFTFNWSNSLYEGKLEKILFASNSIVNIINAR